LEGLLMRTPATKWFVMGRAIDEASAEDGEGGARALLEEVPDAGHRRPELQQRVLVAHRATGPNASSFRLGKIASQSRQKKGCQRPLGRRGTCMRGRIQKGTASRIVGHFKHIRSNAYPKTVVLGQQACMTGVDGGPTPGRESGRTGGGSCRGFS